MAVVWTAARLPHLPVVLAWPLVGWPVCGEGGRRAAAPFPSRSAKVWLVDAVFLEAIRLWADERFEAR